MASRHTRPMPLPPSVLEKNPEDLRLWAADITNWVQQFATDYLTRNQMSDEDIQEDSRRMGFIE